MSLNTIKHRARYPSAILFAMGCAILLMDAILPLRDLWFKEALLTQLGWWPVLPSLILFPGSGLIPPIPQIHAPIGPKVPQSWEQDLLLFGAFVAVFLIYLFALRQLPRLVTRRFILKSTLFLGFLYVLIPIVTSSDIYSYIAYARMGVIHHLNPLATLPTAIRTDSIYNYLFWIDQPSAYGPTWVIISSAWQGIFTLFRLDYLLLMVIALRIQGLAMHLVSTLLIWSISGHLQQLNGGISTARRKLATLAFAWNPLLLFEACVNAHVDTTLLTLLLLSIWFLTRYANRANIRSQPPQEGNNIVRLFTSFADSPSGSLALAAAMFGLATCLKINVILLVPGLFFYVWMLDPVRDRLKHVAAATFTYIGTILVLYAPFWQGGAILKVLSVNPATYRSIHSLADFAGQLYNSISRIFGYRVGTLISSPAERLTHSISIGIFVVVYFLLCWRIIRKPESMRTLQGLLRWMALTWLIYCIFGSPWFWPWYLVLFFGLYALIEAAPAKFGALFDPLSWSVEAEMYFVRLLSFSMLTLYCFTPWGPYHSFVPGLPGFQWEYLSGLWAWVLPLIGTFILMKMRRSRFKAQSWP